MNAPTLIERVGYDMALKLAELHEGERIPSFSEIARTARNAKIWDARQAGVSYDQIAWDYQITTRQVRKIEKFMRNIMRPCNKVN